MSATDPCPDNPLSEAVKADLFEWSIRRAERRRANGFEEYRLRDGCWPGTFYEASDRLHWAWMRILVALGVGRLLRWMRGVLR